MNDIIKSALTEIYHFEPRKPKELWISNVVFCLRKEFFSYLLQPFQKMSDAKLVGIFIHKLIQKKLLESGYVIEQRIECELGDGWKLVGRADAVGEDEIVEIKTTNDYTKPIQDYWIKQANLYAYILEKKHFTILLIDKPTGKFELRSFDVDEKSAVELISSAKQLKEMIEVKKIPEGRKDWCLRFCEFSLLCSNF